MDTFEEGGEKTNKEEENKSRETFFSAAAVRNREIETL